MEGKREFPIFNSHLDLAHFWWEKILQKGDWVIDATCGNGKDTFFLSSLCEGIITLDIQEKALREAWIFLEMQRVDLNKIHFFQQSHESFPPLASTKPIRLIVYNLGYLPGGDKRLTTQLESTITSLKQALSLLLPGGLISLTCYPGHPEGDREEQGILAFSEELEAKVWNVCFHRWKNRKKSPSLLLIQKKN